MTQWLDETEMRAWRGLIEGVRDINAALDDELRAAHGLNEGEYAVLVHLSEAPDHRLRMCDLAGALHLSPSGLTRRLDAMARRGWVKREPSPDDRRVILAVLTTKGIAKLEAAAPRHVQGVREHLLDHLSPAQIRQLGSIFETLRERRSEAKGR